MTQLTIQQAFDLGVQHHQAGRLPEAEQLYRQILDQQPGHAGAVHYLGVLAHHQGNNDVAENLIRQAILLSPGYAVAHANLGLVLKAQGKLDEAIAAYRQAVVLRPDFAETHLHLGLVLQDRGQIDDAIASYRKAISLKADYPQALMVLGNALCKKRQVDEAVVAYRRAVALQPDYADAHNNLGNALSSQGLLDEALAAHRTAIAIDPTSHRNDSNLLYTLYFHPAYDAAAILAEHRRWNERHAAPLRRFIPIHYNDLDPDRRLRVGYVSPNFRRHSQAPFILPLLSGHHHEQFEIFCYADMRRSDPTTQRMRSHCDQWRAVAGLSDTAIAEMVRADGIDILVDLTMHMERGRPLLMARKPAPIQVAYLAYPGTTGLSAMNYRLTDSFLDPPDLGDQAYCEKSVRLPRTFACYDPAAMEENGEEPILAGPPPAQERGYVTFGCLNNFCKVNDGVLDLWSGVLKSTRGSRLRLLAPQGQTRIRVLERISRHGIESGRVEFLDYLPRRQYLSEYHGVDICLDTLPYNGHTTTLDALWMGVPVVTRLGRTAAGRAGWSVLSNLQLQELAAHGDQQFMKIAADLAADLPRLTELRQTMRQRMLDSPVMDANGFARDVEAAYRRMWQERCGISAVR